MDKKAEEYLAAVKIELSKSKVQQKEAKRLDVFHDPELCLLALNYYHKKTFKSFLKFVLKLPDRLKKKLFSPRAALYGEFLGDFLLDIYISTNENAGRSIKRSLYRTIIGSRLVLIIQSPAIIYGKIFCKNYKHKDIVSAIILGIIQDFKSWKNKFHGRTSTILGKYSRNVADTTNLLISPQQVMGHLGLLCYTSLNRNIEELEKLKAGLEKEIEELKKINTERERGNLSHCRVPTYSRNQLANKLGISSSLFSPGRAWNHLLKKIDPETGHAIVTAAKICDFTNRAMRHTDKKAPLLTENGIGDTLKCSTHILIRLK